MTAGVQRLSRKSSTHVQGISKHPQGFIVRKNVKGERVYLGFVRTINAGKKLLENFHG